MKNRRIVFGAILLLLAVVGVYFTACKKWNPLPELPHSTYDYSDSYGKWQLDSTDVYYDGA